MKKSFTALLLLITSVCLSQGIGIIGGVNNSFFTEGIGKGYYVEPSIGLQLGVFAEILVHKNIFFRPKLVYSEQGDRHKTTIEDYSSLELNTVDYKLSYVNLPMDFKFGKKIYAVAGPQIGVVVGERRQNLFLADTKSNFDVGFNLGFGFKVNKFFTEIGAYQGFTTVYTYYYAPTGNVVKVNNGCVKLTFGYYFF